MLIMPIGCWPTIGFTRVYWDGPERGVFNVVSEIESLLSSTSRRFNYLYIVCNYANTT